MQERVLSQGTQILTIIGDLFVFVCLFCLFSFLAHSLFDSIMVGMAWQPEQEAAGHMHPQSENKGPWMLYLA